MSQAQLQHEALGIVKYGAKSVGLIGDVINLSPALERVMPTQPKSRLPVLPQSRAGQVGWGGGGTQSSSPPPPQLGRGTRQSTSVLATWACEEHGRARSFAKGDSFSEPSLGDLDNK